MDTPCIGVCDVNRERGYCTGCKRTLDEIRNWGRMTDEEQEALIAELEVR